MMTPKAPETARPDTISSFVHEALPEARAAVGRGDGGTQERVRLFQVLRAEGVSAYPLLALMAMSVTGVLGSRAIGLVAPDISRTFGLTPEFFTVQALFNQVLGFGVPIAIARLVQNRPRRALVVLLAQGAGALLLAANGLVFSAVGLLIVSLFHSIMSTASGTVEQPLMIDLYPPTVRVRVVSALTISGITASLIATGVAYLLSGPLNLSWRGVYLTCAVIALIGVVLAAGLRDPGYGRYDTAQVREVIRADLEQSDEGERADADAQLVADGGSHGSHGSAAAAQAPAGQDPAHGLADRDEDRSRPGRAITADSTKLSLTEAFARIWAIRSMRILNLSTLVLAMQTPVGIYLGFHLANRFALDIKDRSLLALVGAVAGIVSYLVLAPIGDRIFQRRPARLFYIAGALGMVGLIASTIQMFVYSMTALVVLTIIGAALGGMSGPAVMVGTMTIVPASLRPHVGAVTATCLLLGSAMGTALLGGLAQSIGIPMAVAITTGLSAVSGVMAMLAGRYIAQDMDSVLAEVIEDEYVAHLDRAGNAPLLSVRKMNFGYGPIQVLFDVDFTVGHGDCIALLGVNGAGKSTLLRAICGLGLPLGGTVRVAGHDITYLDADRRARLGIVMIPAEHSVFSELTVMENLRVVGSGLSAPDRRDLDARIEEVFTFFPRLYERRHLAAATLSGGERQMLGISRALIMRPEVLLIDELSLGLAPAVVTELLNAVRAINRRGTAIVLVEQSVNVALAVARRAVFMERGRVLFDGPADQLEDSGLLRAVFLGDEEHRQ